MTTKLNVPKIKALVAELDGLRDELAGINTELEELKETFTSTGLVTTDLEWGAVRKAFEQRKGRKKLAARLHEVQAALGAEKRNIRMPRLYVWQLLVKLQEVSDVMTPEHEANDLFHDLFDWVEDIYDGQAEYMQYMDRDPRGPQLGMLD